MRRRKGLDTQRIQDIHRDTANNRLGPYSCWCYAYQQYHIAVFALFALFLSVVQLLAYWSPDAAGCDGVPSDASRTALHGTNPPATPFQLLIVLPLLGSHARASNESVLHERLAVYSWRHIAQHYFRQHGNSVSVRVLGLVEESSQCSTFTAYQKFFSCVVLPSRCLHADYDNIPTVDCLFDVALEHARKEEVIVFSNGDILFGPDVVAASFAIFAEREEDAVIVGRRTDVNMTISTDLEVPALQELYIQACGKARMEGSLHQDSGVDYFILSPITFQKAFERMRFPPFLIGRYRWDNALLATFIINQDIRTVDATDTILAIHPSTHACDDAYHVQRLGAPYNHGLAHEHYGYAYTLGKIGNSDYVHLRSAALHEDYDMVRRIQLPDEDLLTAFTQLGNNSFLQLVPVLPGDIRQTKIVTKSGAVGTELWPKDTRGLLFVAADENTHLELSWHYPGLVILEEKSFRELSPLSPLAWATFDRLLRYQLPVVILGSLSSLSESGDRDEYKAPALFSNMALNCEIVVKTEQDGQISLAGIRPTIAGMRVWEEYRKCYGHDDREQNASGWNHSIQSPRSTIRRTSRACVENVLTQSPFKLRQCHIGGD